MHKFTPILLSPLLLVWNLTCADPVAYDSPCDAKQSEYAAAAFRFYMTKVHIGEIKSRETFKNANVFDASSTSVGCQLIGSSFANYVGLNATYMRDEEIKALAAAKGTQRFYSVSAKPGSEKGKFLFTVRSIVFHYREGGFIFGGCSYDILIVDEDDDGSPEEVRWPDEPRNGICA